MPSGSFAVNSPAITGSFTGEVALSASFSAELVFTGAFTGLTTYNQFSGNLPITGSFTGLTGLVGQLLANLKFTGSFSGYNNPAGILAGTAFPFKAHFEGLSGTIGSFGIVTPPFLGSFRAYPLIRGNFSGDAPPFLGIFNALTVPITIIYRGVMVNTNNYAATENVDIPVNSLAYFNNMYLAAGPDGLYSIEGTTDNGNKINAVIETGVLDFWKPVQSYPREVWLVKRSNGQMVLYVRGDEHDEYQDPAIRVDNKIHEERIKLPRGMRDRYFIFGLKNEEGADFTLESLKIFFDQADRRR